MAKTIDIDLSNDIPVFNVKLKDKTIQVSIEELYEYALIDYEKHPKSMKARMPEITRQFNEDFGTELNQSQVFILISKAMENVESLVGNSEGSST